MKNQFLGFCLGLSLLAFSCEKDDLLPPAKEFNYDFSMNTEGWIADFADYPTGEDTLFELTYQHDSLPIPLDTTAGALMLSGANRSDDLFMFIKRKVEGLAANTVYELRFQVEVATNAPDGSVGIGGSPANSVYIKAGATPIEPIPINNGEDFYRMNIDIGNQSTDGVDMVVIDDFANGADDFIYQLKTIQNQKSITVTTDGEGSCWIILGTDSGFEGTTTIYFNSISVTFE
jgi:hypothetical protein